MIFFSEYHTQEQLNRIAGFNVSDSHLLIDEIFDMWEYKNYFKKEWRKNRGKPLLILSISTGGWSGNEDVIEALQYNAFWDCFWVKTERGGHYQFEVDFYTLGFKLVSEFTKEVGISRQAVYKRKDKYEWINISHGIKLIRASAFKN